MGTHTVFGAAPPTPPKSPEPSKRPLGNGSASPAKRVRLESASEDEASQQSSPVQGNGATHAKGAKARRDRQAALLPSRTQLPIWNGKAAILKAIEENDTVIILGETGSGKTTQVPQFLLEHNCPCEKPRIAVTQPRRVAATSLARRVAEEAGVKLGHLVGYTVRFDDTSDDTTRLKFVTDGTLLQEMLSDCFLNKYDVVIVDEAHERTLRTDMTLGFLKALQRTRNSPSAAAKPDKKLSKLKVVVMSATIDAERFSSFFNNAPILYVKGRQHNVRINYVAQAQEDYVQATLKTLFTLHTKARLPPGDFLIFLTGEDEIENLASQINKYADSMSPNLDKLVVHKLYAKLSSKVQNDTFAPAPPRTRKVILATNIAETSVTIPGIKYVIDTGMAKEKRYHTAVALNSLTVRPISKSSAKQRAGRAGREHPGICWRLYEESSYNDLEDNSQPEILRCSLEFALLHLYAAGQEDPQTFDFMDRPDEASLRAAIITLIGLGAVDNAGRITDDGRRMAKFPLEPASSRILLASFALGCPTEITSLLAILDSADKLLSVPIGNRDDAKAARAPYMHRGGDHLTLLRLLDAYETARKGGVADASRWLKDMFINGRVMKQIIDAREQLRHRCEAQGLNWKISSGIEGGAAQILQACAAGFFLNTALRHEDGHYRKTTAKTEIKIHPSSVLAETKPRVIMFSELTMTTAVYARTVSEIEPEWLKQFSNGVFARRSA